MFFLKILTCMKKNILLKLLTVIILHSCSQVPDCGLGIEHVKSIKFDPRIWYQYETWDSTSMIVDTVSDFTLYYNYLDNRERMICDIVTNHIRLGDSYNYVKQILGPGDYSDNHLPSGKIETNYSKKDLDEKTKLVYIAGRNPSGDCHLVISFDNNKVVGFFRVSAI